MCCLTVSVAVAQNSVQVTGTVLDELGEPMVGATVSVVGQPTSVCATDLDGKFSLKTPSLKGKLHVTYVGYKPATVDMAGRDNVSIKMDVDNTTLDEVVVVGYGMQKKVTLTGSVSSIGSKDLLKAPMQNVSNLLTGKVSGLTSVQASGQPGADGTTMYVRGYTNFNAPGPLVLVDGVERNMDYVNPNDIESISVLKDAAAAIYGVKGANGVILITTKQGDGAPVISYGTSLSAVTNTAFPEYLNASEFMYYKNKALMMDGLAPLYTADIQQKVLANDPDSPWGETNWFDLIFRTGFTQQHNLSASGSTGKVKYYTSFGYLDQQGTVKETGFKRYNLRTNLDITVAKNLTFTTNVAGYRTSRNWPGASFSKQGEINPIRQASNTAPIIKPTWNGYDLAWKEGSAINVNPYAALYKSGYMNQERYVLNSTWKLEYDFSDIWSPLKGLKASAFFAYDYNQTTDRNYSNPYTLYCFDNQTLATSIENAYGIAKDGTFNRSTSGGESWQFRPQVNYFREFGRNTVSALFFYEANRYYSETMTAYARGLITPDPVDISMGTDKVNATPPSGSHQHTGMVSYAGRANYAWDDRYLLEFAFRYDGSYVFAPENRWGFFPSASAGWVISRENFMKNIQWLNNLKLRASYGENGDNSVTPFLYNNLFGQANNSYVLGGSPVAQFYASQAYVYRNLTWAKTKTVNIGFDFSALQNKIGAEVDIFYKKTVDILEGSSGAYPTSLGGYYPAYGNTGEMDNRGIEIALNHNLVVTKDFNYRLRGIFSFARNKVLKRKVSDSYPNYRAILGQPMGARYGFHALGLFQTQEQIDNYPAAPSGETLPGDIMYQDVNGDGIISSAYDYVKIGYGQVPEMNFSLSADFNYRDFYLNMLWQGVTHCDYQLQGVYDSGTTASTVYTSSFGTGNSPRYLIENAWTPENPNAKYPRLSTVPRFNNAWVSDFWVVNGEYLRLKNLQLGYNVPTKALSHTPFTRVNVYLAGSNLWTLSHFKYIDPESPSVSNGYYPQQRTYSFGLNVSF